MGKQYDFSRGKRVPIRSNKGKTRITIYLDDVVIDAYRKKGDKLGKGYQTLINEALQDSLRRTSSPISASALRKILREELEKAL